MRDTVKGCLVEDVHGVIFTVLDVFAGMVSLRPVGGSEIYTGVNVHAVRFITEEAHS